MPYYSTLMARKNKNWATPDKKIDHSSFYGVSPYHPATADQFSRKYQNL